MKGECEIAVKVIRKKHLEHETRAINDQIRRACEDYDVLFPFCVEVEGMAVMVSKPPYADAMPITSTAPVLKCGRS